MTSNTSRIRNVALSALALLIGLESPAAVEVVRFTAQPADLPATGPVSVIDPRHAWVGLTYTSDAGESWAARVPSPKDAARFADNPPYGQTTVFITAERGWLSGLDSVWMTDDGGLTWQPQLHGRIGGLALIGKAGWIVAGDSHSSWNYTTTDSGQNWSRCGPPWDYSLVGPFGSASFIDAQTGWMTVTNYDRIGRPLVGGVARTADGGCKWDIVWRDTVHPADNLTGIQFVDKDYGWLTASYSRLLQTSDGGSHWHSVALPSVLIESSYLVSKTRGWILGGSDTGSGLYYTSDGGKQWISVSETDLRENQGMAQEIPPSWGAAFLMRLHLRR